MARKTSEENSRRRPRRRAQTPEERENRLIALALDRVEERMENRTATAQEYIQFLRMASSKSRAEAEKVQLELDLVKAKTENLRMQQKNEEMFANAIKAFRRYSGASNEDEDEEELY